MKREILVTAAALLALAACSKKTETAATGTAAPATATAPAPMTPPTRKAGLWAQTLTMAKMTQTTSMCVDAGSEEKVKWWSAGAGKSNDCTEQKITPKLGGGWDFHSVCKAGDAGTVTTDGSATGDFNSDYKVEMTSTSAGSSMPEANGVHKITLEAVYKGPCPADMKPGDMELPGGIKMNMNGGPPTVAGQGGGLDVAKLRAQAMSGHVDPAEIAKMRAQAKAMAAAMKDQQQ